MSSRRRSPAKPPKPAPPAVVESPPPPQAPVARPGRAVRQDCTCEPCPPRHHTDCPACAAWSKKLVLLTDGTTVALAAWILAHEVAQRKDEAP